jgi:hypothetical protein
MTDMTDDEAHAAVRAKMRDILGRLAQLYPDASDVELFSRLVKECCPKSYKVEVEVEGNLIRLPLLSSRTPPSKKTVTRHGSPKHGSAASIHRSRID